MNLILLQPLSLEEMLAKKKAQEEALKKPTFLTKEERTKIALEKRKKQVDAQRNVQDDDRSKRKDFDKMVEDRLPFFYNFTKVKSRYFYFSYIFLFLLLICNPLLLLSTLHGRRRRREDEEKSVEKRLAEKDEVKELESIKEHYLSKLL